MIIEEENTKAATDNSDSNPIEACDLEIKRLEELIRTLDDYVLKQPYKKFLALDLEHYIRNNLECLSICLYCREVIQRYRKMVIELEQQLKEEEK